MFEITDVGWLSLAALALGLLAGGQPSLVGFQAHASIPLHGGPLSLYLSPITQVYIASGPAHDLLWGSGLTLGDTILLTSARRPEGWRKCSDCQRFAQLSLEQPDQAEARALRYELAHVRGWNRFGLAYAERVLVAPCTFDPLAAWADCGDEKAQMRQGIYAQELLEREARMSLLTPTTGVFRLTWP